MANCRFKTAEIEAMKKNILTHIEREAETKTAWRLRCAIEGQLMCCRPSKREAARLERELALYEKLTKNDLPNWQSEPTQPAALTETPRISTQTAETVNVSAEGEKEAERHEITLHSREQVLSYLDKLHGLEYDADEVAYFKDGCTAEEHEDGAIWYVYPDAESDEVIQTLRIALQSPETPQTVECTADTPKPRETARKPQVRGIGRARATRRSGLGAGGYVMLDNASATLTAMHVPRECSTADAVYW